jgi:hypothetical protein
MGMTILLFGYFAVVQTAMPIVGVTFALAVSLLSPLRALRAPMIRGALGGSAGGFVGVVAWFLSLVALVLVCAVFQAIHLDLGSRLPGALVPLSFFGCYGGGLVVGSVWGALGWRHPVRALAHLAVGGILFA